MNFLLAVLFIFAIAKHWWVTALFAVILMAMWNKISD